MNSCEYFKLATVEIAATIAIEMFFFVKKGKMYPFIIVHLVLFNASYTSPLKVLSAVIMLHVASLHTHFNGNKC